jgi:hypothetical protein
MEVALFKRTTYFIRMSRAKLKRPFIDWLFALGLVCLAMWLRAIDLIHFVTADEHNWVYRSGLFLHAILQKDWAGTSVWLTPGVTTTWLGTIALAIYYQLHAEAITQPFLDWLVSFPRNRIDLDVLLALRWSMVLFSALMVGVVYGVARKLWSLPLVLLGTLFLLAEPHLLAVSRIIGHDAPVTFFVATSLLSFLYGKRLLLQAQTFEGNLFQQLIKQRWFIFSGIMGGLAVLSKAIALFLFPFVGLAVLIDVWQDQRRLKSWLWALLTWGSALWITFVLIWPAAWVNPLGQTWAVINNAFLSSVGLEDPDIQPYWAVPDLGGLYYVINGAYKVSPFLMIGGLLAGIAIWLKRRRQKLAWQAFITHDFGLLTVFIITFTIFISLGVKKSPRYILPVFPPLAFIAAWGWLRNLNCFKFLWQPVIIIILGGLALLFTIQYAPYYFTYLNPLVGGSYTAPRVVRIGWGEGLDELGRWLNTQPAAFASHLGVRYTATVSPFYQGDISSPTSDELDYVAFYIKQTQSGYPMPEILAYFESQAALHQVKLAGVDYAQVYHGPAMIPITPPDPQNLPLAYRPYTIYAPIGKELIVDLLWSADFTPRATENLVNLALKSADNMWSLEASAPIIERAPGVIVSTHHFDLPADLARDTYNLVLNGKILGSIKARLMAVPKSFKPLSFVISNQLKLAGIKQTLQTDHLSVDLAWQGWPKAIIDYTVFIQLLDDHGERITGVDLAPERGFTDLDRKEVMVTHYTIPLPSDMRPGSYTMLIGLYYFAGGELVNVGSITLDEPVILE